MHKMIGTSVGLPEDESTPEKRANKIFFGMDSNLDGRLSLEEFLSGAQNDPYLFSLLQAIPMTATTSNSPEEASTAESSDEAQGGGGTDRT